MLHKTMAQADATTDERGSFTAVVSTGSLDRQGERIIRGAFTRSLRRWMASGKMIPILADHEGRVASVVGHIDPRLTAETTEGLSATGVLDLSTELGKRVYELVKSGSLSWSIGFRVPRGGRRQRDDHVELTAVDLAEISVVPVPANADTRTVSVKSMIGGFYAGEARDGSAAKQRITRGEAEARLKALGIEPRPLRIASFEC
jgi:HK97 family phage prohead protease